MKPKSMFAIVWCFWCPVVVLGGAAAQQPRVEEILPRDVTVTGIPGVIAAGAKWQQAWQGTDNADGILGTPDGGVLFAQEQPSTIRKLDRNDYDSAYVKDTHGAGSVAMDSQGRIIAIQRTCTDPGRANLPCSEPPKVSIVHPERERKALADSFQGKPLPRPNDLVVDKRGTVYFSAGAPYYIKPGAPVVGIDASIRSNGIMLSPDEKTLYVTNGGVIVAFDIQPDGSINNRRDFAKLERGNGDGMAVDNAGRLYVASQAPGVQVFGSDGKHLGTIPTPRDVASVAFSGRDKKMLYITTAGALAPNGKEFTLPEEFRNNAKTIYKIPMLAQGYTGRAK